MAWRRPYPLLVLMLAAALATSALGASVAKGGDRAVNLRATPAVKRALRSAFLRSHPGLDPDRVRGPLRGTVYYARLGRTEWALATFSLPRVGTTDQPELFNRRLGASWRDRGDTGGYFCKVPRAVMQVWGLLRLRTGC